VNVNLARTNVAAVDRVAFVQRLVREIAVVPGVTNVAASMITPIQGKGLLDIVSTPGAPSSVRPVAPNGQLSENATGANFITPGWFATYRTPLLAGRDFDARDVEYAIRMPANKTLELAIEDLLFRPRGRPSRKPLRMAGHAPLANKRRIW